MAQKTWTRTEIETMINGNDRAVVAIWQRQIADEWEALGIRHRRGRMFAGPYAVVAWVGHDKLEPFPLASPGRPAGLVFPTPDGQWRWEIWWQSTGRDENCMDTGRSASEWGLVETEFDARKAVCAVFYRITG